MAPRGPAVFAGDLTVELRNTAAGHNKFYGISLCGTVLTTTWGRIGAAKPQSATQSYSTTEAALKEANALYYEKTSVRKGYVPVLADAPATLGAAPAALTTTAKRTADEIIVIDDDETTPEPAPKKPCPVILVTPDAAPDLNVMLAKPWCGDFSAVSNWVVSEKYDGVRAVWSSGKLFTRNGNAVHAPAWFTKDWPDYAMDGELWIAYGRFNDVSGLVRSLKTDDPLWKDVKYIVFDAPTLAGGFLQRINAVSGLGAHASVAVQTPVSDEASLWKTHNVIKAKGGEGLILRNPTSLYESGKRSSNMLKVKTFEECEATVVAYNWMGTGKATSSLLCRLTASPPHLNAHNPTTEFSVTVSAAVKASPPDVGALITIKFFELTNKGVPRFPSFKGLRNDL